MNKEDSEALLRNFFLSVSYKIDVKCSNQCGINQYEEFMCKLKNVEDLQGLDYRSSLDCYDKCLSKLFASSILGVDMTQRRFIL